MNNVLTHPVPQAAAALPTAVATTDCQLQSPSCDLQLSVVHCTPQPAHFLVSTAGRTNCHYSDLGRCDSLSVCLPTGLPAAPAYDMNQRLRIGSTWAPSRSFLLSQYIQPITSAQSLYPLVFAQRISRGR